MVSSRKSRRRIFVWPGWSGLERAETSAQVCQLLEVVNCACVIERGGTPSAGAMDSNAKLAGGECLAMRDVQKTIGLDRPQRSDFTMVLEGQTFAAPRRFEGVGNPCAILAHLVTRPSQVGSSRTRCTRIRFH